MPNKKKELEQEAVMKPAQEHYVPEGTDIASNPEPLVLEHPKPYEYRNWRGAVYVYQCSSCGHCENQEDDMKLHVLKHYPVPQQLEVLDNLTKEK